MLLGTCRVCEVLHPKCSRQDWMSTMSWSVTINNIPEYKGFDSDVIERMLTQHIAYPGDMQLALNLARQVGLKSCVLTGMHTPNPYGGDEVVDISIRGML